jgi:tetratricopeptide (TPR) repeat protein
VGSSTATPAGALQPFEPASKSISEGIEETVDTQTRHALKQDKFARAAKSGASWVEGHRTGVLRWVISAGVVVIVSVAVLIYWNMRTSAADLALGQAIDLYTNPLATPGEPPEKGVYTTAEARATEANREFVAVAHNFRWLPEAAKAHYFAGVSYEDLNQDEKAETELKAAAGSSNRNLANLAKYALAGLYHQMNRDSTAIDLYNAIIAKPSETVSASVAQLALADLYVAEGKQDQARSLWAKIKDLNKDTAAATIAQQKLTARQ